MTILFWLLFVIDVLLCLLAIIGKGFREDFGASAINTWFTVLLFSGTGGGLIVHFVLKKPVLGLVLVSLPVLVMIIWYFIDTRGGK